jgi:hypothetical protein
MTDEISNDISTDLRIEGPAPGARREDTGITVEYLGVRIIIAPRMLKRGDKGVWVLVSANNPSLVQLELEGEEAELAHG